MKTEEISEMKVRRDMAESKLQSTGKEGDERILRLQNQIEDAANDVKKKERLVEINVSIILVVF